MTSPLVSVIMPCFNAERFIGDTLHNVLQQSWMNVEVLVVDDGSTDGSLQVAEKFRDRRLRIVRQANAGACRARNLALSLASGDYIQYLDADDLLSENKIAAQIERLSSHPNAIASTKWSRFRSDLADAKVVQEDTWIDLEPLDWIARAWGTGVPNHSVHMWLIPRAVCIAAGPWNEALVQNTDGEYMTRVILAAERVLFCPEAVAYYRSGMPGTMSRRKGVAQRESRFLALHLCERNVLRRENSPRMRRAFGLAWRNIAHVVYPYDRALAEQALARARALSPAGLKPGGGPLFDIAVAVLGWRAARQLQVLSGRP